ncbi:MAG TPA: NAD(P)-dependent oxidoreductase [Acidimicrobiia bacterium]|jgi:D-3-phosphoglycerate dehydrogenase
MADRPVALVTAPFRGEGMDELGKIADVVYDPWLEHRPLRIYKAEDLAQRIDDEGADIVIVESDQVKGPVFERKLRVIGSCRGDPNNVDLAAATAAGIPIVNAPGRNADAVAEMTLALLFAVNRWIVQGDADVRSGQVYANGVIPYQRYRAWQLSGQTAGIVGLGSVGRATKWRLEGIGMKVLSFDPYNPAATHRDLDAMLAECDVVSMHAMVTPETTGMVGEQQFAAMKPGAVFVNSARAMLHDTDALVAALQSGHLGGAGLDHFIGEHLPTDHPLVSMKNVVLTPHIGGATYDVETNQASMVAADVARVLAGEKPLHCVNPEVLG